MNNDCRPGMACHIRPVSKLALTNNDFRATEADPVFRSISTGDLSDDAPKGRVLAGVRNLLSNTEPVCGVVRHVSSPVQLAAKRPLRPKLHILDGNPVRQAIALFDLCDQVTLFPDR